MRLNSNKNSFEPRSRLLLQLGDKLIRNENIALLELIKNSYDADARKVKLRLENIESPPKGIIDIIDDGEGMDIDIIENVWLEPGSDYKQDIFKKNIRTTRYGRLPIGEKGIGRFGVHKLGYQIELISKKKNFNEVVVKIDWEKFAKNKYLKDARFEVYENTDPQYFKGPRTGTRIRITNLRTAWDRRMVRDLYKSVFSLQSPFKRPGNFDVIFELSNPEFIADLPNWENIKHFSLFNFKCRLEGSVITNFEYNFTPWAELYKVEEKKITTENEVIVDNETIKEKIAGKKKEYRIINLEKNYSNSPQEEKKIGPIEIEGFIFDRDKNILELYNHSGVNLLKEYLDEQGGVRVYREGIRINEYGEPGNDWLNLDSRRVNEPTRKISNNIILAIIDLKRDLSQALEEKTNREGFIENDAFYDFKAAILYVLQLIEKFREIDKAEIRSKYGQKEQAEPVIHHLGILKQLVDEKVVNLEDNTQITKQIEKVEEDYLRIQDILFTSAGAGLTLAIGLHEIEKVVAEANALVQLENVPESIKGVVNRIDTLMENYSTILRNDGNQENNIAKLIDTAIFNIEYRLRKHQVLIVSAYKEKTEVIVKSSRRFLLGSIMSILDNSIHWLHVKEQKQEKISEKFEKKIFIDIIDNNKYLEILIADNGVGFTIPTSQLTHPFITTKAYGMGLGLHIVSLLMKSQGGDVSFPDHREYNIPQEFWAGALVVLKINRSQNDFTQ